MKRHTALLQLSREHHTALKLARQARFAFDAGLEEAVTQAARVVREAFAEELEPHFRAEEEDLLPALAAAGAADLVRRTLDEHAELRDLNRRLAEPDVDTLGRFAALLNEHVRFEERELFEAAQQLLYPDD